MTYDDPQRSAFYEPFRTPYDRQASPPGPRGALHEGWEEPAHTSVAGPSKTSLVPSHLALRQPDGPVRSDDIFFASHTAEIHRTHAICREGH